MNLTFFKDARDVDELFSLASYCRDRVNYQLFHFSYSVAILHRPDTRNQTLDNYAEIYGCKFVNNGLLSNCTEELFLIPSEIRRPIDVTRPDVIDKKPESRFFQFIPRFNYKKMYIFYLQQIVVLS
jgi:Hemocyanin, all-alpha domain